jgi:hypothetical protein
VFASVATVEPEHRQHVEQVDVPVDHDLLPRRGAGILERARVLRVATGEFEERIPDGGAVVQPEGRCVVRPRAVYVQADPGIAVAAQVVPEDLGPGSVQAR